LKRSAWEGTASQKEKGGVGEDGVSGDALAKSKGTVLIQGRKKKARGKDRPVPPDFSQKEKKSVKELFSKRGVGNKGGEGDPEYLHTAANRKNTAHKTMWEKEGLFERNVRKARQGRVRTEGFRPNLQRIHGSRRKKKKRSPRHK